jgi:tRNA-Thr(GGU) m(6)t(6)A37 methyltransferase TsaA
MAVYISHIKTQLLKMAKLRDGERRGRVASERSKRKSAQKSASTKGYAMSVIGVMTTPFPDRRGTPRQGTVAPAAEGILNFEKSIIPPEALQNLEGFSHVWLIWVFHENTNAGKDGRNSFTAKVTPPRLGEKVGVFSTRSPHRPNAIGISVCALRSVDSHARKLRLAGVDLVDGTPILDVKPYIPYDSVPCHVPAWVEPPVEGVLSSGLGVVFSALALKDLDILFDTQPTPSYLRVFGKRRQDYAECVQQVIAQDPRSVLLKRADSTQDPFKLVIDGLEVTFVNDDSRMLVTQVSVSKR